MRGTTVEDRTLQLNLDALATSAGAASDILACNPDGVRVDVTRSGPTAAIRTPDGRWIQLHSGRDPVAEAESRVASLMADGHPPVIIVIGLGLGYLLDAIERRAPAARILALEPLPAVAHAMLARRTWQDWLTTGRLTLLVGPRYAGAAEAWRCLDAGVDAPLVVAPVLEREFRAEVARARDIVTRAQFGAKANAQARRMFAPRYLLNTVRNIPVIAGSADVTALFDAFASVPAVVIAAGPSLDRNIDELRSARGRALLIAVDTALRPLLEAGIAPEMVVAVDPSEVNARHLTDLPDATKTWLVAEGSVDPAAFRQFGGRTFTFSVSDHHPWPWLRSAGLERGRLRAWGSVLTSALDLALRAGCSPILFAGADLAYSGRRPYCRGTMYEHEWAARAACGQSLADIWNSVTDETATMTVMDVVGRPVPTAPSLLAFRDWLVEQSVSNTDRRFINVTGGGVLMGGRIEQRSVSEVLTAPPERLPPGVVAVGAAWAEGRQTDASDPLSMDRVLARLSDASASEEPLASWLEFGSPDLTADAVEEAVLRAVEWREGAHQGVAASPSSAPAVRGAPERVLAIRAAILGQPPTGSASVVDGPDGVSVTPAMALARARRLLVGLVRTSGLLDPRAAPTDWMQPDAVPASRAFAWSARAAKLVLEYESALAELVACRRAPDDPELRAALDRLRIVLDRTDTADRRVMSMLDDASGDMAPWLALLADLLSVLAVLEGEPDGFIPAREGRAVPLHVAAALVRSHAEALRGGVGTGGHDAAEARDVAAAVALTGALLPVPPTGGPAPAPPRRPPSLSIVLAGAIADDDPVSLSISPPHRRHVDTGAESLWSRTARADTPAEWVVPLRLNTPSLPCMIGNRFDAARALFAIVNGTHSLCVDESGRCEPDAPWPKPISGQVRWGAEGAIAWHNAETSYVMWRERAGGAVHDESIPFTACLAFPQADGSIWWTASSGGLWSWMPGRAWHRLVDSPPLMALQIDARGVCLQPSGDTSTFKTRPPLTHAFHWTPGSHVLETVPLGREGPCWSTASTGGWTALAFPHSDTIRLRQRGGAERVLTCTYPFNVAWAGSSLVVSTGGAELMLFRNLLACLKQDAPAPPFDTGSAVVRSLDRVDGAGPVVAPIDHPARPGDDARPGGVTERPAHAVGDGAG